MSRAPAFATIIILRFGLENRTSGTESKLAAALPLQNIGQPAGGVAHEFNNLLAVIGGNADIVLLDPDQLSSEAKDCLRQVTAATERAADLLQQLLLFSRKQVMQSRPIDLNDLVSNLTKMLKRLIGERILLVEDEDGVRALTRRVLEKYGYLVSEAASGVQALGEYSACATQSHSLLTDMVMPGGMTGRELAEHLRAQNPSLEVVFTSGYNDEAIGRDTRLHRRTRSEFLPKPCTPQQILETVRKCLDNHRRHQNGAPAPHASAIKAGMTSLASCR